MSSDSSYQVLVGIDFGTTKTLLAHCRPSSDDISLFEESIPTVVGFSKSKWLIGKDVLFGASPDIQILDRFKLNIGSTKKNRFGILSADIAGVFLAELRKRFIDREHCSIAGLTITVPAEWSVNERQATLYAARLAGFDCPIWLLEEPLAAYLRIRHQHEGRLAKHKNVLIFDFGGGTCDISVIVPFAPDDPDKRRVKKSITVKAGGVNIDDLIVAFWLERKGIPSGANKLLEEKLRFEAESYKKILSNRVHEHRSHNDTLDLSTIKPEDPPRLYPLEKSGGDTLDLSITGQDLENLVLLPTENHGDGIIPTVEKKLNSFLETYDPNREVDCVILSGGTCRLWIVQDLIKSIFEKNYTNVEFLPDESNYSTIDQSVARGAGLNRYYINKGDPVAIPPLNHDVRVTIETPNKVIQTIMFDAGTILPTDFLQDVLKLRWNFISFTRRRQPIAKIEIQRDNRWQVECITPLKLVDTLSPLGQLAYFCSIDEHGLVRLALRIVDIMRWQRPRKPVLLYPAQKEFDITNKSMIFELQKRLKIQGSKYDG